MFEPFHPLSPDGPTDPHLIQGERHCVVYATGSSTFFGRAAALIASTNNVANVQVGWRKDKGCTF